MRTWRHRGGWLLAAGLLACLPASALTNAEVAQLTFVEQSELPRLMADRVTYLPDGHVAVGGWFEWPNAPVVAVIPNDLAAMQIGTQAASPRFAVAPDGKSLAFWKRVRVGQQDRAELTIVRLDSQMVTTLGEPVAVSESMHLAWLPGDGPLVYATEDAPRGVGVLYALDLAGGKPRKLVELHEGQWKGLQTGAAPGRVTALWAGSTVAAYSVNCLPGDYVPPTPASLAAPAPDDSKRTLEVDPGGQLVLAVSDVEGVVVDREVRGAQWRPDGQAICYVKDKQLWIVGAAGTEPRLLATVADAGVFLRGCCWSPNGVNIAYWGVAGTSGRGWRASLGQERITASFAFPKDAPVKAENRVWVVGKYQKDAFGSVVEPVWNTLKAVFVVTRILRTPEGIQAEAINSGAQAGTLERLAASTIPTPEGVGHITIGVAGQAAATWSRTSTLKFRPELTGWLEKTKYVGQPQSLTVERQLLTPLGQ